MRRTLLTLGLMLTGLCSAQTGARYLIISTDALAGSIQPLAQWKHARGVETRVVPLSQVGYDTTAIRNYIRNAWSTWNPRPEYVLLVGAPMNLPARYFSGQWPYYSDNLYGDMTGDLRQEIPVGRLPAKSAAQLDVMVAKILRYEKNPDLADTIWMRKMTTVIGDRGDDDAWVYWSDARNAITLARTSGFIAFDSLASSRGDTAPDIHNSVNSGTGIILFRGTAQANWYRPFAVDVNACNSGKRLPIVLSITCETMTLAPGESMVGEAWLKAGTTENAKGGVAFFGNTHSATNAAQVRSAVCRGFMTGLFSEGKWHLGDAVVRAKQQLYAEYPSYTSDYRGFNLLGDPELGVWSGLPATLSVSHPAQIQQGPQQVTVEVLRSAAPVENALVCLSMDSTVYARGYTDPQGSVTFDVGPTHDGWLRVVASGRNLYPYDSVIEVGQVGTEEPGKAPGPARMTATPAVFAHATRLSWPSAAGSNLRVYNAAGTLVLHARAAGSFDWDGRSGAGLACPPGVYVARLEGPAAAAVRLLKLD